MNWFELDSVNYSELDGLALLVQNWRKTGSICSEIGGNAFGMFIFLLSEAFLQITAGLRGIITALV